MRPLEIEVANLAAQGASGFVELGGRRLTVRPPTFADMATLQRHLVREKRKLDQRKQEIARKEKLQDTIAILESLKAIGLPDAEIVNAAIKMRALGPEQPQKTGQELAGQSFSAEEFNELFLTPDGAAILLFHYTREDHKDLSFEAIRKDIDEDNYLSVLAEIGHATGLTDLAPNGPGGTGTGS
jgi:hypothetical protein